NAVLPTVWPPQNRRQLSDSWGAMPVARGGYARVELSCPRRAVGMPPKVTQTETVLSSPDRTQVLPHTSRSTASEESAPFPCRTPRFPFLAAIEIRAASAPSNRIRGRTGGAATVLLKTHSMRLHDPRTACCCPCRREPRPDHAG